MGKRTDLYLAAVVALAAAVAVAAWLVTTRPGINRYGYDSIREGMTVADVTAALGKPPGDYTTARAGPAAVPSDVEWWVSDQKCASGADWLADDAAIWVGFSEDGKAVGKHFRGR